VASPGAALHGDGAAASAAALHLHTRGQRFGVFTASAGGGGAQQQQQQQQPVGVLGVLQSWVPPGVLACALLLTAVLQLYVLLPHLCR
jgi:hypothetical protein